MLNKKLEEISIVAIGLIVLAIAVVRFFLLEVSPPGFYVDESAFASAVICLLQNGTDALGNRYPLFGQSEFGALYSPTGMYLGTLWVKFFGSSIVSLRAFPAFLTMLTIVGMICLAVRLFDWKLALLVALTASISPWSFQFSRIAWDPPMMICLFCVWGTYYYLRPSSWSNSVLSALLFGLAMYSYAPGRLFVPLLVGLLSGLKFVSFKTRWAHFCLFAVAIGGMLLPLVRKVLNGEVMGRFNMLSIFSPGYLQSIGKDVSWVSKLEVFRDSFMKYFTSNFLFTHGDNNMRHSTWAIGTLSWVDDLALILFLVFLIFWIVARRRLAVEKAGSLSSGLMLIVCLFATIAGMLPAMLTWEGSPHVLRSISAWPFWTISSALMLWQVQRVFPVIWSLVAVVAFIYSGYFASSYFINYPVASAAWYDASIKNDAVLARQNNNWPDFVARHLDYHESGRRYYLMQYGNYSCTESLSMVSSAQ